MKVKEEMMRQDAEAGMKKDLEVCAEAIIKLEDQVKELLGQKRQLEQLLTHTILLNGQTPANPFWQNVLRTHPDANSLYEDWERFLTGDIRCDEPFYEDDTVPSVHPGAESYHSPEPLQRTRTCPPAPKRLARIAEDTDASVVVESVTVSVSDA